jgi:hypothetical protein
MLVYLDHAQLSVLDILFRRDAGAFAEFLNFWLHHGCQLIISRAHLHEIGQSEDERDVEKRLDLLKYFSILSGDPGENVDWVIIYEMIHQALQRLNPEPAPASEAYVPMRDKLYRPTEHSAIESWIRAARPALLEEMRTRRDMARFDNTSMDLRNKYRSVSSRKEPKWDPEAWRMMPIVDRIAPDLRGDLVGDRWNAEVRSRTRECFRRAKNKRKALLCIYDLDGFTCANGAPEQDLSRLGFYRALAQKWVLQYCRRAGHALDAVQAVLDQLVLYEAPGISAALAVERGRKLHEKDYEASDYMDVDHVLWGAHADLAFIDKRTHGFLLQARRNPKVANLLSPHLKVRFERAAHLDDVKKHIRLLAEERSRAAD